MLSRSFNINEAQRLLRRIWEDKYYEKEPQSGLSSKSVDDGFPNKHQNTSW